MKGRKMPDPDELLRRNTRVIQSSTPVAIQVGGETVPMPSKPQRPAQGRKENSEAGAEADQPGSEETAKGEEAGGGSRLRVEIRSELASEWDADQALLLGGDEVSLEALKVMDLQAAAASVVWPTSALGRITWQEHARWAWAGAGHAMRTYYPQTYRVATFPVEDEAMLWEGGLLARHQLLQLMSERREVAHILAGITLGEARPCHAASHLGPAKMIEVMNLLQPRELLERIGVDPSSLHLTQGGNIKGGRLQLLPGEDQSCPAVERTITSITWHQLALRWLYSQSKSQRVEGDEPD